MTLKEIFYPNPTPKREMGEKCPECNIPTNHTQIPCPNSGKVMATLDGAMPKCCVIHWGYRCVICARIYEQVPDE